MKILSIFILLVISLASNCQELNNKQSIDSALNKYKKERFSFPAESHCIAFSRSDAFIDQKLEYMHKNPCSGKWNLALSPVAYVHSSAQYYTEGVNGIYTVTNFKELEDINFTKLT